MFSFPKFAQASASKSTVRSNRPRPAVEPLEGRQLLSGTVSLAAGGYLTYTGTAGRDEVFFDKLTDGRVRVVENRAVVFTTTATVVELNFFGLGGDDDVTVSMTLTNLSKYFEGGPGNDRISVGNRGVAVGQAGNDQLIGTGVSATLYGGTGADVLSGGTVTYADRGDFLKLSIDGVANDGGPGEKDNIVNPIRLVGGKGNDMIHGSWRGEELYGGPGNDRIWGNDGNDYVDGGEGNDVLTSSKGADVFAGGPGVDTVDYSSRTDALVLTLDGVANDGGKGEKDDVRSDVENLTGGSGNDKITGNISANVLRGGGGADQLYGRGGNDQLFGGAGADALFGEDGDDRLDARDGVKDFLAGGLGTDTGVIDSVDGYVGIENVA